MRNAGYTKQYAYIRAYVYVRVCTKTSPNNPFDRARIPDHTQEYTAPASPNFIPGAPWTGFHRTRDPCRFSCPGQGPPGSIFTPNGTPWTNFYIKRDCLGRFSYPSTQDRRQGRTPWADFCTTWDPLGRFSYPGQGPLGPIFYHMGPLGQIFIPRTGTPWTDYFSTRDPLDRFLLHTEPRESTFTPHWTPWTTFHTTRDPWTYCNTTRDPLDRFPTLGYSVSDKEGDRQHQAASVCLRVREARPSRRVMISTPTTSLLLSQHRHRFWYSSCRGGGGKWRTDRGGSFKTESAQKRAVRRQHFRGCASISYVPPIYII